MSKITKVTDHETFVESFDSVHWTHLRRVIRNFRAPAEFYHVHIDGKKVGLNDAAYTMLGWCLENIERQPKVRTEYAALSTLGDYFFVEYADALNFYLRFGDEYGV
jgi:hypothetical protein